MSDGMALAVELEDDASPKIFKIVNGVEDVGKASKKTGNTFVKQFNRMSKTAGKMASKVARLATSLPAMLGAAGGAAGMGLLVKQGLAFNGTLEAIETQFTVILGSASKARDVMADIVKFSAETPFQLAEVAAAGKMLEAFGLGGIDNLRLVGDAAAAAQRPIEEIAMVFGRIKSGAFGEAFMRLAETGLATREMLEAEGLQFNKSGSFTGTAEQAITAVNQIIGTRFGGMMDKMSKTWGGALSTMKDNWNLLVGAITKPAFELLKPKIAEIIALLTKWRESGHAERIAKGLAEAIEGAIKTVSAIVGWLVKWWRTIVDVTQVLAGAATAIGAVAGAIYLWSQRQAILNAVMSANPVMIWVGLLGAAVVVILKVVKAIGGWGVAWAYVMAGIKSGWAYMKGFFESVWAGLKWLGNTWWAYAELIFEVWKAIGGTAWDAMGAMVGIVGDAALAITNMFKDVGEGIFKAITFQFDDMKDAFGRVGDSVAAGWNSAVDRVDAIGQDRFNKIGEKVGDLAGTAAGSGFLAQWDASMDKAGTAAANAMAVARGKMDEALAGASGPVGGSGAAGPSAESMFIPDPAPAEAAGDHMVETWRANNERMAAHSKGLAEYNKELWTTGAGDFAELMETGFADAMSATVLEFETLKTALDDIWVGIKESFVKMTMDMMSSWLFAKVKMGIAAVLFEKKATAAAVTGSTTRAAASATETAATSASIGADVASSGAKTFKAHSHIPFVGAAIAAGLIALMVATMAGLGGKASGGLIPGNGSGIEDNQVWRLSGGEYVQPKAAVNYYGAGFMEAIRTRQFNPGAAGGAAAAYVPVTNNNTLNLAVDAGAGVPDDDDVERDLEEMVVPIFERWIGQRRFKLTG